MKRELFFAVGVFLFAACSQVEQAIPEDPASSLGDLVEKVVFEVLPIKDGDPMETKASAVPNGTIVNFVWEASDTVGIYPDKGSQVYFSIEDGVGTSSVSFDGGGWALKQNSSYVSYYPFVGDIYLKRDKIPVSFAGQKQKGLTSPFSGARYYLATETSTSTNGVLTFTYNTLNTIINVNATLPAGTYTKMSLNLSEPLFVEEGTYSLDDRKIVGTKYTKTLEIELEDFTLTEQGTVPVYIMSAPVDLRGKEVVVRFTKSDGAKYKCTKSVSREYLANTRYGLTCDQMQKEAEIINFVDPEVKRLCVENWDSDGDGELDMDEAAEVTDLGTVFGNNKQITSFDELQYFTGLTEIKGGRYYDRENQQYLYYAFTDCSNLHSILLPESLNTIGEYALYDCGIESIIIPAGVTSIGRDAFAGTKIESIIIPEGVTSIGMGAFYRCSNLESISIPSTVVSIEGCNGGYFNVIQSDGLFVCCSSLTSIVISPDNPIYDSRDNCNAIIETATNKLLIGCKNTIIPNTVEVIGYAALGGDPYSDFFSDFPDTVIIPDSVKEIDSYAFSYRKNLTSIFIYATTPPVAGGMFDDTNNCPIFVPAGSVAAYKSASGWSDYSDRIFSMEGGTVPGSGDGGDD